MEGNNGAGSKRSAINGQRSGLSDQRSAFSGQRLKATKFLRRRYIPANLISGDVSFTVTISAATKEPFSQRTNSNLSTPGCKTYAGSRTIRSAVNSLCSAVKAWTPKFRCSAGPTSFGRAANRDSPVQISPAPGEAAGWLAGLRFHFKSGCL